MNNLDIKKYIDMALRRKWWIIIPFLTVFLVGLYYSMTRQKIYEAKAVILVQPQKLPRNFVQPIVTSSVQDRLQTITQQITSRTNLEKIIREYRLYNERNMLLYDKVELLRKRIRIDVANRGRTRGGAAAFTIAVSDEDPRKATDITNAIASRYIGENLKIREVQATGTSDFLSTELESVKKQLEKKEAVLSAYKQKHLGALPDQLDANLRMLERLQGQLEQLNNSLRDAENRKLLIQKQIADAEKMGEQMSQTGGDLLSLDMGDENQNLPMESESEELAKAKKTLALLKSRYTENHPDVKRLEAMIAKMEDEKKKESRPPQAQGPDAASSPAELPLQFQPGNLMKPQLEQVNAEIKQLRSEIRDTQGKMKRYDARVEDTPKRQEELVSITRDYNDLKGVYQSLLKRKLEAQIAVNMEKRQKGEQFRILDTAKLPQRPVAPETIKILLLTFVLGLGLGGGMAYLVEMLDTSFRDPKEVEKFLGMPVLLSMPIRYTARELKQRKRRKVLAYASVSVGFLVAAFAIVVTTKGLDKTLAFLQGIVTRM